MKKLITYLSLLSIMQIQAMNCDDYSPVTFGTLACLNAAAIYDDISRTPNAALDSCVLTGLKTFCCLTASDLIATHVANDWHNENPVVKNHCMIAANLCCLTVARECDKLILGQKQ